MAASLLDPLFSNWTYFTPAVYMEQIIGYYQQRKRLVPESQYSSFDLQQSTVLDLSVSRRLCPYQT